MLSEKIGFVGAGQMAHALARGLVQAQLVPPAHFCFFDPVPDTARQFADQLAGAELAVGNAEVVGAADVVILAVKPQSLPAVMQQLSATPKEGKLFISILAGTSLQTLCQGLGTNRVIRVMPNTPCLVGCGASGYALGPDATAADGELVGRMFSAVGVAFQLEEASLDAVTGLSGSGPAYVYGIIEALSDGAVCVGLSRETATALAAQTVLGAAQMVLTTGEHPGVLKDRVTSPGGTTAAGLQVLERRAIRSALIDAVQAATQRSRELGRPSE